MKKTLIALAVLAASGASFAQSSVTLTGSAAYGYQSTKTSGVTTSGFGADTAAVTFTATEDLGGGLKATAQMTAAALQRGTDAANGENMTVTLAGDFGTVQAGAIEIGSGIRGLAQAGAPVNNMEGEILAAAVDADFVKYTSPSFSGFNGSVTLVEGTTAGGADLSNGFGKGMSKGNGRAMAYGIGYANGPLTVAADFTDWVNNAADSRVRLSGAYDMGALKVGAGYEDIKGTDTKYTMLGVSAPLGAVTIGAVFINKDAPAATTNGYSLGLKYAFSKRTSLDTSYSAFDGSTTAKDNKFKSLLVHNF